MPDAAGRFRGIAVNAAAWDRIFAPTPRQAVPTLSECEVVPQPTTKDAS